MVGRRIRIAGDAILEGHYVSKRSRHPKGIFAFLAQFGDYRYLGQRIGHGYETAKSRQRFLDFIDAHAMLLLDERKLVVRFQKPAHNPLLLDAGFESTNTPIPWLGNRRLVFQFG